MTDDDIPSDSSCGDNMVVGTKDLNACTSGHDNTVVGEPLTEFVTSDPYLLKVLEVAAAENGVREDPALGQNRGARVDEYIRSTHLDPAGNPPHGYPWCACFVYWCFARAADILGQSNPCWRTASVLVHWDKTSGRKIFAADVGRDHSLVLPGMIFCKSYNHESHTGIVCQVADSGIVTIEGNTNVAGSREGDSVEAGKLRPWDYVKLGFIDYTGMSRRVST